MQRVIFVGNSLTYQPKELGGVPGIVHRVASAHLGLDLQCTAITKGGADLLELWDDFEAFALGDAGPPWASVVLQIGRAEDADATRVTLGETLRHRYGPLLRKVAPDGLRVILYHTWRDPADSDIPGSPEGVEVCKMALQKAGLGDVQVAAVGDAFQHLRRDAAADRSLFPALFKDDMGHPSALAGLLIATVIVLALASGGGLQAGSTAKRPLSQVLEAILPPAWRTASPGYAGEAQVGQRGWRDTRRTLLAGLVENDEEDGPLSRYPPGMRTEKRTLGPAPCDALTRAALATTGLPAPLFTGAAPQAPGRRWKVK